MKRIKKAIRILRKQGPGTFFFKTVNVARSALRPFYVRYIFPSRKEKILKEIASFRSDDRNKIFNFIFKKYFGVFGAWQVKSEFMELLRIVEDMQPKYVLEIGTAGGGALFCFARLSSSDAVLISVDLPEGRFGGGYEESKIPFFRAFKKDNQKLSLIREDSHRDSTLVSVKRILNGQKLDFLFIDGDHTYEGAKRDFKMYGPLVRKGGVIAFHDIVDGLEQFVGGVPRFWKEIKLGHQCKEFVQDWEQGGYGIGVLFI